MESSDMDNVSLSFSQEEVVLILKILGAETIPGVGQEPFGEVSEDVERHLMASAERTLRARGMISIADERINIDRVVVALIGTCAVPQYSWLVTRTESEQLPENRFYHMSPTLFVEHIISGPGIHTFTAVAEKKQIVARLVDFWQLHSQMEEQQPRVVSMEFMQGVLEKVMFASNGSETSSDLLSTEHQEFAEQVLSINTVAMVDHRGEEALQLTPQSGATENNGLTSTSFLQLEKSLWQTIRRADQQIELQPISPEAVGEQVEQWLTVRLNERNN